jgi:hypothetical protein
MPSARAGRFVRRTDGAPESRPRWTKANDPHRAEPVEALPHRLDRAAAEDAPRRGQIADHAGLRVPQVDARLQD